MPTNTPSSSSSGNSKTGDPAVETMPLGMAPAVAAAAIYGSLAQSTSLLYQNAVAAQQQTMAGTVLAFGAVLQSLARTAPDAKTAASGISDAEAVLKFVKTLQPGQ